jgi:hypothetical protein
VDESTEGISAVDVRHDAEVCRGHGTFGNQETQSSMRSFLVVVLSVGAKDAIEAPGAGDQQPVQAVCANGLHPAFGLLVETLTRTRRLPISMKKST